MFNMAENVLRKPITKQASSRLLKEISEIKSPQSSSFSDWMSGEYMYVEMAHYTDDDKVVLICVTNTDDYKVHEYKLEKLNDKNWQYIIQRFCSGNSSDQILNNVETLFNSLEFKNLVMKIYKLIVAERHSAMLQSKIMRLQDQSNESLNSFK